MAFDVAIVGGGIIGCALAWRLAREGASVALLERGEVGQEASWAAGGQLVPAAEPGRPRQLVDHWVASARMYPRFVEELREETGAQLELRFCGRLSVATDESSLDQLRQHYARQGPAGVRVEWWSAAQVRAAEPALPEVLGGIHWVDDGFVENRRVVPALARAAAKRGAQLRTWTPVARVLVERDRAHGVELVGGERVAAGAVVNAAGAWAGQVGGATPVPVGPSKGQMAALEPSSMPVGRIVGFPGVTVVPRADGRLLLAATKESVGYDKRTTLWAVEHLLRHTLSHLPGLRDSTFVEAWTGLRPRAEDEVPLVGESVVAGLYYATGHYSMGITSAPATAEALTGLLLRGRSPLPIDAFSPRRFEAS